MDKRIIIFIAAALILSTGIFVYRKVLGSTDNVPMFYTITPTEFAEVGDTVEFRDMSEGVDRVKWNFGDGEYSVEKRAKHTYVSPGEYSISLTVYGSFGYKTDSKKKIIIKEAKPEPIIEEEVQEDIILGPEDVYTGTPANFESKHTAQSYMWYVENDERYKGRIQNTKTATYSFNSPGIVYIVLNTTNPTAEYRKKVIVSSAKPASVRRNPPPAPKPRPKPRKQEDVAPIEIPGAREF